MLSSNDLPTEIDERGNGPLHRAIESKNFDQFQALLADPNTDVNALNHSEETPLYLAAKMRHLAMVEALVTKGADAGIASKDDGKTPLIAAIGATHPYPVEEENLIKIIHVLAQAKNFDVNQRQEKTLSANYSPSLTTAISTAVGLQSVSVIRVLHQLGADMHATSRGGYTPLITAADNGFLDIVDVILECGGFATLNYQTNYGNTALMMACQRINNADHMTVVIRLLEVGADRTIKNEDGQTAADRVPTRYREFFNSLGMLNTVNRVSQLLSNAHETDTTENNSQNDYLKVISKILLMFHDNLLKIKSLEELNETMTNLGLLIASHSAYENTDRLAHMLFKFTALNGDGTAQRIVSQFKNHAETLSKQSPTPSKRDLRHSH